MVESAEVVQHREDILRINLKVFSRTGSPPLSQSQEAPCSKRLYSPSPSKQGALKKRTRLRLHLNNEDDGISGAELDDIDQLAEDEAVETESKLVQRTYPNIFLLHRIFRETGVR